MSTANTSNELFEEEEEQYGYDVPIRDINDTPSSIRDALTSISASGIHHDQHHSDASSAGGSAWAPFDTSTQSALEQELELHSQSEEADGQPRKSLQDRLVNAASGAGTSALLGSLELLKIAGGLTLSTTGTIIAPSLKVTQQVILPSLFAAVMDYIKKLTPQRVKDWLRILSSTVVNFFSVLQETPRGKEFRSRLVTVGGDVVDCLSSDASRQVITDGMATFVKLGEAMHTPEFKAFLEQSNVFGARMIDSAALGRNKQLLYDLKETFWSGIELASDPKTIVALAEVTATLCHTLEMEEVLHRRRKQDPKRRYERNQFTQKAYTDANLMQDPDITVEQVIMSGLGNVSTIESTGPPLSVTVKPLESCSTNESANESSSLEEQEGPHQRVNREYLERKIHERADTRAQQIDQSRWLRTTVATVQQESAETSSSPHVKRVDTEELSDEIEDLVAETVLENEEDNEASQGLLERQTTPKASNTQIQSGSALANQGPEMKLNSVPRYDAVRQATESAMAVELEPSAVTQFYRTLDEIMARKREEAVAEMNEGEVLETIKGLTLQPKASASAKKKGFPALQRAAKKAALVQNLLDKVNKTSRKDSRLLMSASVIFLFIVTGWFAFGCYGMYAFFSANVGNRIGLEYGDPHGVAGSKDHSISHAGSTQEIVIRVIKEVVHVNQHRERIEYGGAEVNPLGVDAEHVSAAAGLSVGASEQAEPLDVDKIVQCVSGDVSEQDEPLDVKKIAECISRAV